MIELEHPLLIVRSLAFAVLLLLLGGLLIIPSHLQVVAQEGSSPQISPVQGPDDRIIIGSNVQVSKAFGEKSHAETYLAAHPRNPNILLGGSMVWSPEKNKYTVVAYGSFDGGRNWSPTLTFDDDLYHSDPAMAFDTSGNAYFLQIGATWATREYFTYFHRSKDGGKTWLPATRFRMYDRHYVAVDDSEGKRHGWLYIHGKQGSLPGTDGVRSGSILGILRSTDGGTTFEPPTLLQGTPGQPHVGGAQSVVLSDGTLVIPFIEFHRPEIDIEGSQFTPNGWLKVISSEDGGKTFSRAVIVSRVTLGHDEISTPNHFSFAVDSSRGTFTNRLYTAWSNTHGSGSDILLSYSSDKGKSWSNPVVVNDDRPPFDPNQGRVHFRPMVAVNRDGVIGISWYDKRESSNNLDWRTRFTASLDGGETFLSSVNVSESAYTHENDKRFQIYPHGSGKAYGYGGGSLINLQINVDQSYIGGGHTAGLAANADGVFYPFWVDNRTGIAQAWTAPVRVKGKSARNGDVGLSELDDVSDKIKIVYTSAKYDSKTGTVSFDAQAENTSNETIIGPVKVRVISLKSPAGGTVKILTTDNKLNGIGAIWDFSSLLVDGKLKPGDKSEVKKLEFSISDLRPLEERIRTRLGWRPLQLVELNGKVLGVTEKKHTASAK